MKIIFWHQSSVNFACLEKRNELTSEQTQKSELNGRSVLTTTRSFIKTYSIGTSYLLYFSF